MAEREKGDIGTTGKEGGGVQPPAADAEMTRGAGGSADRGSGGAAVDNNATAESEGSIASGGGDVDLTQASGGAVD
jgi:hypothetical protein